MIVKQLVTGATEYDRARDKRVPYPHYAVVWDSTRLDRLGILVVACGGGSSVTTSGKGPLLQQLCGRKMVMPIVITSFP